MFYTLATCTLISNKAQHIKNRTMAHVLAFMNDKKYFPRLYFKLTLQTDMKQNVHVILDTVTTIESLKEYLIWYSNELYLQ